MAINNLHMQEVADPTYWAQSTDELVYTTHGETPLFWIRDEDGLFHELGLSQQNSDVLLHLAENHGRYVAAETLGQIIGEVGQLPQVVREVRKEILAKNPSIGGEIFIILDEQ